MPLKGEARLRQQARWREKQTPAYFAWLYARRKLRMENAELFRVVIEEVLALSPPPRVRALLEGALADADRAEVEVGNRFDHARDRPYYQAEGMMLG